MPVNQFIPDHTLMVLSSLHDYETKLHLKENNR